MASNPSPSGQPARLVSSPKARQPIRPRDETRRPGNSSSSKAAGSSILGADDPQQGAASPADVAQRAQAPDDVEPAETAGRAQAPDDVEPTTEDDVEPTTEDDVEPTTEDDVEPAETAGRAQAPDDVEPTTAERAQAPDDVEPAETAGGGAETAGGGAETAGGGAETNWDEDDAMEADDDVDPRFVGAYEGDDGWWYSQDHEPLGYYDETDQWVEYIPQPETYEPAQDEATYDDPATTPQGYTETSSWGDNAEDWGQSDIAPQATPGADTMAAQWGQASEAPAAQQPDEWDQPAGAWEDQPGQSDEESFIASFDNAAQPTQDAHNTYAADQPAQDDPFANYVDGTRQKPRPTRGWRKAVVTLTRGAIVPRLSADEQEEQALLTDIDRRVKQHRVTFSDLKGGVGKTTTTLGVGTVFSMNRRDTTVALDANPDRGTLAYRAGQENPRTVRDLLNNIDAIRTVNDLRDYLSATQGRLEILASDPEPAKARTFSPDEYRAILNLFTSYRQIVLTDTGTDLTTALIQEIMNSTDTLVVPTTTAQDGAYLGWQTLDAWEHPDRGPRGADLVRNAVVAISQSAEEKQVPLDDLVSKYSTRVREVVVIPRDAHLAAGSVFDWGSLAPPTQRAYLRLSAAIARGFPGQLGR